MNLFQKGVLNLAIKTGAVKLTDHNDYKFFGLGGGFSFGKTLKSDDALINEGFASNTDVFSIVSLIAEAGSDIPFVLYEKTRDGLVPVTEGELFDILKNPNDKQVMKEFKEQSLGYLLTTGDFFWRGFDLPGFGDAFQALEILPSNITEVLVNKVLEPSGYKVSIQGLSYGLNTDEVWHGKYFNPTKEGITSLRGLSPLQAGYRALTASNELITAEAHVYKNKGVSGILSSGTDISMSDDEAEAIQKNYNEKIGGADKANGVTVTTANIKFQQIGMSPSDLEIFKSGNIKLQQLCRLYGIDSKLLNDPKGSTYNNVTEVSKQLYTRAVIPNNERLVSALNRFLIPAWSKQDKKDYIIKQDLSGIESLQTDQKEEALKNKAVVDGINTILSSPVSKEAKIWQLINVYSVAEDEAKKIVGNGQQEEKRN